ncbi:MULTISPECIES: hypothetical protein [unclassified Microbacterium]|uniref:hypothetical protein n=1 Tax=unclassified Microbacterium TaxID=2609290 RepID=UPI000EA96EA7|nr:MULTISPECIES: hypothetical protein [unclassified Microbacterium]MBT2484343.1 hypothetical protein [Microbacterium sp. ISL-108]RKN67258.1 hypothetical protein D7252_06505 [Microbacterium sp. CGR2]
MGLFQHRPEEQENQWAGLPSEPLDRGSDVLDTAPVVDPMTLGLGAEVSSIVFPVAPPPAAAFSIESREPDEGDEPEESEESDQSDDSDVGDADDSHAG